MMYHMGRSIRETGQALDRVGQKISGNVKHKEFLSRHNNVLPLYLKKTKPTFDVNVFIAENASVIGQVTIGSESGILYGATVRGDISKIDIGAKTIIGENTVIHVNSKDSLNEEETPTTIGSNVFIHEASTLHGCSVLDGAVIKSGAVVLDGAVVGKNSVVEAGSLVSYGKKIPDAQVWAGVPARYVRDVTEQEIAENLKKVEKEIEIIKQHKEIYDSIKNSKAEEANNWPEFWATQ